MSLQALVWGVHRFLWVAALLALWVFFTGEGNRRFAKNIGDGQIEFAPSWIQVGAWAAMIIYSLNGAADAFQHHHENFSNVVAGGGLVFVAILLILMFPGTIIVAPDGLRQAYWFSKRKNIRWDEIVEINTGKKNRAVTITGANPMKIIHTTQLPDKARLLLELKRHCGDNLPPDFPRESLSSRN